MTKRGELEGTVCGFIQKLWDILQVKLQLYRIRNSNNFYYGIAVALPSPFSTPKDSKKLCCRSSFATAN